MDNTILITLAVLLAVVLALVWYQRNKYVPYTTTEWREQMRKHQLGVRRCQ